MKNIIVVLIVAMVSMSFAGVRIAERVSDIDGDTTIKITSKCKLASIVGDVQVSSQTNAYTVTATSYFTVASTAYTNTYAIKASYNDIQGSEAEVFFNYDSDSATGDASWLKAGDILNLNGSTSTYYKVVFETL